MCPEVDCTVACNWKEAAVVMTGLADRLVSMIISLGSANIRMAALQIAFSNCSRLREIKCSCKGEDMDYLKKLLPLVKGSSLSLDVDVWMSDTFDEDDDLDDETAFEQEAIFIMKKGKEYCIIWVQLANFWKPCY